MRRMLTRRANQGRRAVWLLIPLLVLAAFRPICGCAGEGHGHCATVGLQEALASCCGDDEAAEDRARGFDSSSPGPCSADNDCCCVDSGDPLTQVSETATLDPQTVTAPVADPRAMVFTDPAKGRAGTISQWASREHSPPLFMVNCTFRC